MSGFNDRRPYPPPPPEQPERGALLVEPHPERDDGQRHQTEREGPVGVHPEPHDRIAQIAAVLEQHQQPRRSLAE
jgi:hypothetical protein